MSILEFPDRRPEASDITHLHDSFHCSERRRNSRRNQVPEMTMGQALLTFARCLLSFGVEAARLAPVYLRPKPRQQSTPEKPW